MASTTSFISTAHASYTILDRQEPVVGSVIQAGGEPEDDAQGNDLPPLEQTIQSTAACPGLNQHE